MVSTRRMTSTKALSMFLATVLAAPLALAGTEQDPLNVFNNMAQETVECAAYYGVVAVGFENSNEHNAAKKYEEIRDNALERAIAITQQAGLKPETVGARFDMAVTKMSKRIDENTSNISILIADYNDLCIEVMTNMEERAQYWMEHGAKELGERPKQPPQ